MHCSALCGLSPIEDDYLWQDDVITLSTEYDCQSTAALTLIARNIFSVAEEGVIQAKELSFQASLLKFFHPEQHLQLLAQNQLCFQGGSLCLHGKIYCSAAKISLIGDVVTLQGSEQDRLSIIAQEDLKIRANILTIQHVDVHIPASYIFDLWYEQLIIRDVRVFSKEDENKTFIPIADMASYRDFCMQALKREDACFVFPPNYGTLKENNRKNRRPSLKKLFMRKKR